MLNLKMNLDTNIFNPEKLKWIPTRNGFGEGLVLAGEKNPNVVALTADLEESTRFLAFHKKFPERFIDVGVAEQNLMGVAAGMALNGKIPFIGSYATFSPGRNWDQLRVSVCYNNLPVKIAGAHAGLSVGPDGATHQALEDIAITRVLPNITVIVPCDYHEARKAAMAAAEMPGPVYVRFARPNTAVLTTENTPFEVGKATLLWDSGDDVAIVGAGPQLYEALLAAKTLSEKKPAKGDKKLGVKVLNLHTIKPIDEKMLFALGKKTGAFVVVEEHQIHGGVFGAVAETMAQICPIPIESVSVADTFGESGEHQELLEKYGLLAEDIIEAVGRVMKRKV
ncbi:MAG: transketolase [Parcubacteria group bacterium Gr01-1014_18]|nr:MAG: transketolase [Parcubacteria group bacterium Greene0416_36]TSC81444.1 MAG: transketolase [Parcubacteria group bacterium Gr01-1014_18]TSC99042.1 MAG: transketolase [Parcubacteria group bacterium Greene1014_20]TSD07277.1 MAG: transketolase [Parcubacteria group bacterium Greene0714_2]